MELGEGELATLTQPEGHVHGVLPLPAQLLWCPGSGHSCSSWGLAVTPPPTWGGGRQAGTGRSSNRGNGRDVRDSPAPQPAEQHRARGAGSPAEGWPSG